jgi:hypothetical protein
MKRACRNVLFLAHGVAEGQIDGSQAAFLRRHAAGCSSCSRVLAGARSILTGLHQASSRPLAAPPADLVHRIMARLPEASARQRLWIAVGGSAAAASAAVVFVAALARLLPAMGGRNLLPGLQDSLAATGAWLGRFAALLEVSGGLPLPGSSSISLATGPSIMPALLLIATGLMGLTAVLALTVTRPSQPVRPRFLAKG